MIGEAGSLGWRHVVGGMYPAEVEVGNLQSQRKAVVSQDFAVPERLAGEPAVEKADIEVLPLHVVYRHSGPVRFAHDRNAFDVLQLYRPFPPWRPSAKADTIEGDFCGRCSRVSIRQQKHSGRQQSDNP